MNEGAVSLWKTTLPLLTAITEHSRESFFAQYLATDVEDLEGKIMAFRGNSEKMDSTRREIKNRRKFMLPDGSVVLGDTENKLGGG